MFKALKEVWRYADEALSLSNKAGKKVGTDTPPIWRSIDTEETYIIVDALIRAGMANPYIATAVRGVAQAYHQLEVGIILMPRFVETWKFYAEYGFGAAIGPIPGVS